MELIVPTVPIAFIDMDDTLVCRNTNTLWISWRIRRDPRSLLEVPIALHNLRYMSRGTLTQGQISRYYRVRSLGYSVQGFQKAIDRFFEEKGKGQIYREAPTLIRAHRERGIRTVLITGQESLIAKKFQDYLGIDDLICNTRETKDGRLGGFSGINCYGEGKVTLAGAYLQGRGISLDQCSFYTDSISDLPLLRRVGHPIAVNPDPRLREVARENSWKVMEFSLGANN